MNKKIIWFSIYLSLIASQTHAKPYTQKESFCKESICTCKQTICDGECIEQEVECAEGMAKECIEQQVECTEGMQPEEREVSYNCFNKAVEENGGEAAPADTETMIYTTTPPLTFQGTVQGTKDDKIDLRACDLSNSTFEPGTTFKYVNFRGASFPSLMTIKDVTFDHCSFEGATFLSTPLDGVTFSFCYLQDALFNYATIENTIFYGSILKNAIMSPTIINNALFALTNLENTNFSSSALVNVGFTYMSKLRGASFATLSKDPVSTNVYFGQIPTSSGISKDIIDKTNTISGVDVSKSTGNVDLSGTTFSGAINNISITDNLIGTNMTGAILSGTWSNPTLKNICATNNSNKKICKDFTTRAALSVFIKNPI